MKTSLSAIACALTCATVGATEFNVDALPPGAEVTVPGNTQTLLGSDAHVRLSTTESVQTLRFTAIATGGKVPQAIKVAIFDRRLDRVKKVKLAPHMPFLYSFQKMSSIDVRSEASALSSQLLVESDKPISIAK